MELFPYISMQGFLFLCLSCLGKLDKGITRVIMLLDTVPHIVHSEDTCTVYAHMVHRMMQFVQINFLFDFILICPLQVCRVVSHHSTASGSSANTHRVRYHTHLLLFYIEVGVVFSLQRRWRYTMMWTMTSSVATTR